MEAARLILVRHAQAANVPDLPEPDWPLTEEGAAQAEALADELHALTVDHLWSSPFARALATLQPYADQTRAPLRIHHDLRERMLSPGPLDDWQTHLKRSFDDPDYALAGGESGRDCVSRFGAALTEIAGQHRGETVAVASHGNAIALFLRTLDPMLGFDFWQSIRNPHLFHLLWNGVFTWLNDR